MLLISGSGRSGTSAVARLIHEAGLSVGHDLIEADESNAEGYFEERPLIELNDRILRDAGLHEWFSSASRADVLAAASAHLEDMRALVEGATPAWKDPRFCWTLEAWLGVLPERPRVIVCLRSPDEVAASTMRYYGLTGEEAGGAVEHLWRVQYERLLEVLAEYELHAMCVEYGALHRAPRGTLAPLERFVGRKLDVSLMRRDLRHHQQGVPEHLAELYERVRSLTAPRARERAGSA